MIYPEKVKYTREKLLLTQDGNGCCARVNVIIVCRWESKNKSNMKAKKRHAISVLKTD